MSQSGAWNCHLLLRQDNDKTWNSDIVKMLQKPLQLMYGQRISKQHVRSTYGAVVIKNPENDQIIACSLLWFHPFPDNAFVTGMEGVLPAYRRRGVGKLLFEAIEAAVLYLAKRDGFIRLNLLGMENVEIETCIDNKSECLWMQTWLEGMNFTREESNATEIKMIKELRVPPMEG
jgi:GNAT superfamily N-acetyltransferase